jgi:hypothetical protein
MWCAVSKLRGVGGAVIQLLKYLLFIKAYNIHGICSTDSDRHLPRRQRFVTVNSEREPHGFWRGEEGLGVLC